ncbi:helix-turn-helix domain-containing protein [Mycolicibacterium celeriflavum]|uniref:helix-turn-helix domain-containing protein n=1 Tax=Mycolicibacterium celeriflavum TaxID=1249101 RepID=UPI003CF4A7B7
MLRGADAPLSIAEIAEQLDIHANTARFHLEALVNSGRVEAVEVVPGQRVLVRFCCATVRSWRLQAPAAMWSARYISGSCKARWRFGMHRSPSTR